MFWSSSVLVKIGGPPYIFLICWYNGAVTTSCIEFIVGDGRCGMSRWLNHRIYNLYGSVFWMLTTNCDKPVEMCSGSSNFFTLEWNGLGEVNELLEKLDADVFGELFSLGINSVTWPESFKTFPLIGLTSIFTVLHLKVFCQLSG